MDRPEVLPHETEAASLGNTPTELYRRISQYPFAADRDWCLGLSAILGHPESDPTEEELSSQSDLILQAQCFYLARKFNLPPIDAAAYKEYKVSEASRLPTEGSVRSPPPKRPSAPTPQTATTSATDSAVNASSQAADSAGPAPPYPTSFAEIVDLITQNKPIPGIEEVPTTILEPGSSKQDHTARRRKPWEKDTAETLKSPSENVNVETATRSGEGVMKILQPNAVPDSGLIAKQ